MENAAKALVISGGVLLAILILSVGVYLRGKLQDTTTAYVDTLDTAELRKFNSPFEVYANNEKEVTAQDIVTLIGIAQKTGWEISIFVDGVDYSGYSESEKHDFLNHNIYTKKADGSVEHAFKYDEKNHPLQYDSDGRVCAIGFRKK